MQQIEIKNESIIRAVVRRRQGENGNETWEDIEENPVAKVHFRR